MKTTLKRLSACSCGFPALREEIKLGTEYEIDPSRREPISMLCGGCGKILRLMGVHVERREDSWGGLLPEKIFQEPGFEQRFCCSARARTCGMMILPDASETDAWVFNSFAEFVLHATDIKIEPKKN